MLLDRYSIGFALAELLTTPSLSRHRFAPNGVPSRSPVYHAACQPTHSQNPVNDVSLPFNRQPDRCPINNLAILQLTFRLVSKSQSHLTSIATPPTSSNEYRLLSIGIRSRSQEKRESSRRFRARHLSHDARSAFAFSQCSQQTDKFETFANVGTNLQRRSDSMLRRSFESRNTFVACVPSRGAVFWVHRNSNRSRSTNFTRMQL